MSGRMKIYSWCFLIAISLRLFLIYKTPSRDKDIDLMIYRAAGQLVANGVNPYDFNDHIELREQLRANKNNYNEWVCSDQDKWNYYTNANLPLATLFFGAIEYCFASPKAFRYTFALFDSILAVLILAFLLNRWQSSIPDNRFFNKLPPGLRKNITLIIGISLAFSPILFLWGTYIPEPKGTGILLILSSLYFSGSTNKKLSMILSPVMLGFSVAFIGLGVFIAPICLINLYLNNEKPFGKIVIYTLISILSCIICLVPFMPELLKMMQSRMNSAVQPVPEHGSMWALLYKMLPETWLLIKNIFILLFISINIIGFFKRRIDLVVLFVNLLFLFACVYLTNSSMDRMNIALLTLIILLGFSQIFRITSILWFIYILYSIFSFTWSYFHGIRQDFDSTFVLLFTVLYFVLLVVQTFATGSSLYEVPRSFKHS